MRVLLWFIFIVLLIFFSSISVRAESDYVLPYPSFMPGSKFYQLQLLKDAVLKYWYFGNLGQFYYNLKQSDKYLVEAKTLFEYKQYLLGTQALKKSDTYFSNTLPYLIKAKKENKNITQKQKLLEEASLKHIDVLNLIRKEIPEIFVWQPEKSLPTKLNLKKSIEESINIRKKFYE